MTAQITDQVFYEDDRYSITGIKGGELPTPFDFGMVPTMMSTACYRGFYNEYTVMEGKLLLTKMTVRVMDNQYKPIQNVPGTEDKWSGRVYSGLNLNTAFTGNLLLGTGFINTMYVHMGFQKATSYEKVVHLILDNGEVKAAVDYSEKMAQLREQMRQRQETARLSGQKNDETTIKNWIGQMFSLDYDLDL
ncbi:MAG: hypothetical protein K8L97_28950 [Anaerolineae bacterium]|nr:hypothetical protein [Anaerolineae bacterium]